MSSITPESKPIIEISGLRKSFGDNHVLTGVDLSVHQGKVTTIIGKSGTGKSVLLKCVAGLLKPNAGSVRFEGDDIWSGASASRNRHMHDVLSYMFQNNALFDSMTIEQNVGLPLSERSRATGLEIREKIEELLQKLDLQPDILGRYPSQLSGGMQKRVALARALITDPTVVLFDEPTTGLDPVRKNTVYEMISRYQEKFGFTALMVSHDIPDVLCISNHIAILDEGRFQFSGSPNDLKDSNPPIPAASSHLEFQNPYQQKILAYLA